VGRGIVITADIGAGLANRLKAQAFGVGFDLAGIARLGPAETADAFDDWISKGYAGDMSYLPRGADKRRDTRTPFPGAVSALVVGMDYGGKEPSGPVARYARGDDYHEIMWAKLDSLHEWIEAELGHPVAGKSYVDTGPILERDLARRAGLGWFGKNTNLINPGRGSFFFIGSLLLGIDLEPDTPFEADRCGSCTRCLDACPTGAFAGPRVLDATRCISYLTIESREPVPLELREALGSLLYGCDICQDVCPWNHRFSASLAEDSLFAPREALRERDAVALARDLLAMTTEDFRLSFSRSPMKRAKFDGLRRNAAIVLGNAGSEDDIDTLTAALEDPSPVVREHAAWALDLIHARRASQD
jgi:epoxyqueuosine reductase